jgi:hypothetical protein
MNAYNATGGFAAAARTVSRDRRSPFSDAHADAAPQLHNARGLVLAVLMSVACWAGVGIAFLL